MKKWIIALFAVMVFTVILSGCSTTATPEVPETAKEGTPKAIIAEETKLPEVKPKEPVTIKVGVPPFANIEYDTIFSESVKKQLPHVTLEKIQLGGGPTYDVDIISKGLEPDIIMMGLASNWIISIKELGLDFDLTPMAMAAGIDFNRFDQSRLTTAKFADGEPDITVIPYLVDLSALYYNRAVFDKFGVEYPRDGMTWEQVIELARKVTRLDEGIQYRGLEADALARPASQLGLLMVDSETGKVSMNNSGWKEVLSRMKTIYSIPGNEKYSWFAAARKEFAESGTLAMLAAYGPDGFDQIQSFDWDLVTYPVTKDAPNTTLALGGRGLAVTSLSKNKEAAFEVVNLWVSNDIQQQLSKIGRAPAIADAELQKVFAADIPGFQGKNMQALFKLEPKVVENVSEYESVASSVLQPIYKKMLDEGLDENTTIRLLEEAAQAELDKIIDK